TMLTPPASVAANPHRGCSTHANIMPAAPPLRALMAVPPGGRRPAPGTFPGAGRGRPWGPEREDHERQRRTTAAVPLLHLPILPPRPGGDAGRRGAVPA